MNQNNDIREELKAIAPKLAEAERKNLFKTPDYYFQGLPDKVMERVRKKQPSWTTTVENILNKTLTFILQPKIALPFATCLMIAAIAIGLYQGSSDTPDFDKQLAAVSTEELNAYLQDNLDDDELEILMATASPELSLSDFSRDELLDYLNTNTDNQIPEEDFL